MHEVAKSGILLFRNLQFLRRFNATSKNLLFTLPQSKHLCISILKHMTIGEIHTEKGVMKIEFYDQDAPNTVKNFVDLAKKGFYGGVTFHRVIPDFVIQGGDPTGTGAGGPGYKINCELTGGNQFHDRGVLSMAHAGRNTGGSQFFVCHSRTNTAHLDRNHTCFGRVVEGLEVIDAIRQGDKMTKVVITEETAA
jgi:peptidyl-prolyl cis-trans isomerase B (cyclophilin B)